MQLPQSLMTHRRILSSFPLLAWGGVVLLGIFSAVLVLLNDYVMHLPLFFDTIGTLVATAAFGIFPGAVAAVITHLLVEAFNETQVIMLMYVPVNIASAVVLGMMIKQSHFETPVDAVLAIVLITAVNVVLGAVIATFLYTGSTGHPVDYLASSFMAIGRNIISASFWARLPINVIDKGIAVLIAYGAKRLWFDRWVDIRREGEDAGEAVRVRRFH